MKLPRRDFLCLTAGAAVLPAASRIATAQTYPTRPITIVVPFAAGGGGDTIARIVVERMRGPLGQPIIIENVTGADGIIGARRAARARPDGYTICLGNIDTHVLNGAFYSLQYDVLNDFAPIAPLIVTPLVLFARKTMPLARDLNEFIAWLKANPDKASAGVVTLGLRLMTVFFQSNGDDGRAAPRYRRRDRRRHLARSPTRAEWGRRSTVQCLARHESVIIQGENF
jgi:tripartite-type tricarboxylate transporter receptor subunit TctC